MTAAASAVRRISARQQDRRLADGTPRCAAFWLQCGLKAPKSKYGRRFSSQQNAPLHASNLLVRVIKPAMEEVGGPWARFHTLRHTRASRLFAAGGNPVQVQRWLGHRSPAFTLSVYAHLMDDLGAPLAAAA